MQCTHEPFSYAIGSQMTRDVHIYSDTRTVIRAVYRKMKPEARRAEHRGQRHSVIRAALDATHSGRDLAIKFRL